MNTSKPTSPDATAEPFLAVADLLPDALLLVSTRGRIRAANRACHVAIGLHPRDLTGRDLTEVCSTSDPGAVRAYLRRCSASRDPLLGSLTFHGAEPVDCRVNGALYATRAQAGEPVILLRAVRKSRTVSQFALLNRQIAALGQAMARRMRMEAEREELLQREQAARRQAEAASRMKDDFLAVLSHELRTPLNAILGWANILQLGGVSSEQLALGLATIERNARAQTRLIDDLLDASRIAAGRLHLQRDTVDLRQVVEAAAESIRPAVDNKQIALRLDWTATPVIVHGDAGRLQQVVWNLLSNAVKFTPVGGQVTVAIERREAEAGIIVTDTGVGWRRDLEPLLFQRFWQADQSFTRAHGGLGLGLAIVRQLVEAHGGTVQATSQGEGRGAAFSVWLPLLPQAQAPVAPGTLEGQAP